MLKAVALVVVVLGMIVFSSACQNKKSQDEQDALAGIKELHRKDIEASKARDFEILLSLWTDDGVLLELSEKMPLKLIWMNRPKSARLTRLKNMNINGRRLRSLEIGLLNGGFSMQRLK